jgi:hypothetical protein
VHLEFSDIVDGGPVVHDDALERGEVFIFTVLVRGVDSGKA